jgi:hypothetical protein
MMREKTAVDRRVNALYLLVSSALAKAGSYDIDRDELLYAIQAFVSPTKKSFDKEWYDYEYYPIVYEFDGYAVYKTKFDRDGNELSSKRLFTKAELNRVYKALKEILIGLGLKEDEVDEYILNGYYADRLDVFAEFIYRYGDMARVLVEIGKLYYETLKKPRISEIRASGYLLINEPELFKKILTKLAKSKIDYAVIPNFIVESLNRDSRFEEVFI